jgi:putative membrane protein
MMSGAASAHTIETVGPPEIEWWLILLLLVSAALYALGVRALWQSAGRGHGVSATQALAFLSGWLVLALALLPPLDPLGAGLFSAHMLQHELLMLVAAPLMILGRPLGAWVWAVPTSWRPGIGVVTRRAWVTRSWHVLTDPLSAWVLHAAAIWLWHVPRFFTAALKYEGIHILQHLSFFVSALLFWWALLRRPSIGNPMTIVYLLTTMLHTGALGAFLIFSKIIWYPVYAQQAAAWNMSALEDQQLGGLIMWIPGGLVYVFAAVVLVSRWLVAAGGSRRPRFAPTRPSPGSLK